MKNTYFGMTDALDILDNYFSRINNKKQDNLMLDKVFKTDGYQIKQENGSIIIEVIVVGHTPECIKVKYNNGTKLIRIEDTCDVPEESRPWYYQTLNLEFSLPKTTKPETFNKKIENGVLTITAKYDTEKNIENVLDIEI